MATAGATTRAAARITDRAPLPLRLPAAGWRRIREHAGAAWPREACGLLTRAGPDARAAPLRVHACRNLAGAPMRAYEIDPEVFLRLDRAAAAEGGAVVGVWHSHPHGDPRPSPRDAEAAWPGWSYLIVGLRPGQCTGPRAWQCSGGRLAAQPVELIERPNRGTP